MGTTPAADDAEDFLRRVFPDPDPGTELDTDPGEVPSTAALRGVDERTQRLLEPLGDPDRESW